ncbi:MAG: DUF6364 family protein [Gammaproteobacteria bacterium]
METAKLTIRLPRQEVEFAKGYAEAHGITVTEVIDRLLCGMQAFEHTALHLEIEAISGLVPPDVDVQSEHRRQLVERHSRRSWWI